jgi:zinc D-Ala-D-Ala carboxypeptidase
LFFEMKNWPQKKGKQGSDPLTHTNQTRNSSFFGGFCHIERDGRVFQRARDLLVVAIVVSAALLFVAVFAVRSGRGQSQNPNKPAGVDTGSKVRPTVLTPDPRGAATREEAALSASATRNAAFQTELAWMFGGKKQSGWYLYTALIGRTLRTDENPDSKGFASAVARWQEESILKTTGLLDEESFMAMVAQWQGARLKNRAVAEAQQLLTAPADDFFDPERVEELRQVEHETYAAYKRMVAAAVADRSLSLAHDSKGRLSSAEKYLKIISAFRSREYQEKLRRESPNAGSAGLAVNSPHFTGRALDLYVGGDPVDTRDVNRAIQVKTPVYLWLVRNAERFGFRPYFYEPWHWEYVK